MIRLYYGLQKQYSKYYDGIGNEIATTYSDLLHWFKTQPDVTEVLNISFSPPCGMYKIFSVESMGYVPPYIMGDGTLPSNRIFGQELSLYDPDFTKLCGTLTVPLCNKPVIGTITATSVTCPTPTVGTVTVTPQQANYAVSGSGSWVINNNISLSTIDNNLATLTIQVKNANYHQQSGHTTISNETIGVLDSHVAPLATAVLSNDNNPQIPVGSSVTINTNGNVQFSGPTIVEDSTGGTVEFANLLYLIDNS
jgi:hypothetical protein